MSVTVHISDSTRTLRNVRSTLKSGYSSWRVACPLCARSKHSRDDEKKKDQLAATPVNCTLTTKPQPPIFVHQPSGITG